MTEWGGLHTDTHVSGTDGFSFVTLVRPAWSPKDEHLIEFIKTLLPDESDRPAMWKNIENYVEQNRLAGGINDLAYQSVKIFLCKSMSNTFALGQMSKGNLLIGAKNHADIFKLKLKFPEVSATKVWDANTLFYVRVKKGEKFISDGNASVGHRRQFSDEGW